MGRKVSLTENVAKELEFYWKLVGDKLTDEDICHKVGVRFPQLRGWLQRNVKPVGPDGKPGPLGLRDLRARARVTVMTGYLAELNREARDAHGAGDYRTASTIWMWLLEKQFPTKFGKLITVATEGPVSGVLLVGGEVDLETWKTRASRQQGQNGVTDGDRSADAEDEYPG